MEFKKILVLENDIESQGLPDPIEDMLEVAKLPYKVWWWFGQDVSQNGEKSLKRFSELSEDTLILSYPSFVGYDNSFEEKLHLFKKLKDHGIKLTMCIFYYPSFFNFILDKLHRWGNYPKDNQKYIDLLMECIDYHNIYSVDNFNTRFKGKSLTDESTKISIESINRYFFNTNRKNPDKVRVIATGKIYPVYAVYIDEDELENSKIVLLIENDPNNSFKFSEIERIIPEPEKPFEPKPTGRKVRILKVQAVGKTFENLKEGDLVDELDCKEIDPDPNRKGGLWVMGVGEPVKLLNERGAREYEIIFK